MRKTIKQVRLEFEEEYKKDPRAFHICPFCRKVDVSPKHVNECGDPDEIAYRQANEENMWKD